MVNSSARLFKNGLPLCELLLGFTLRLGGGLRDAGAGGGGNTGAGGGANVTRRILLGAGVFFLGEVFLFGTFIIGNKNGFNATLYDPILWFLVCSLLFLLAARESLSLPLTVPYPLLLRSCFAKICLGFVLGLFGLSDAIHLGTVICIYISNVFFV